MNSRRFVVPLFWILAVVLLAAFAFSLFFFLTGRQGQRALPAVGPHVLITAPTPSLAAVPAASLLVEAVSYGENPIHHIELWMDGELIQTYFNPHVEAPAPVEISFTPILSAGDHLLFVRAIDTHNLIGQSLPIMAAGDGSIVGEGPFEMVSISPGDSLEETLMIHDADLGVVLSANPHLSAESASPGTIIAIPRPEEQPPQNPAASAPPGNAIILEITEFLPIGPLPFQMIPARVLGPPSAPSNLSAAVNGCDVAFSWNDTSEEETGFNIWVTGLGMAPHIAARTQDHAQTGPVTTQLAARRSGDFVYWVEAVNAFGAQPSNQVRVSIGATCPHTAADRLVIEALDFSGPGQYDRAYCYISVENDAELRMPAAQDQFIPMLTGKADMTKWPLAARSFQIPPPVDNVLDLQGECWGWAAGALSKLGSFNGSHPQAQWDGSRQALSGGNFEIGLSVNIAGGSNTLILFNAPDPGIPAPYDAAVPDKLTSLSASAIADPSKNERTLTWKWNGDPTQIDGFRVMVGDIPFMQINDPSARQASLTIPGFCDTQIPLHVEAYAGDKHSLPSNKIILLSRNCLFYAEVQFFSIFFDWTHDSFEMKVYDMRNCDPFELWFELSVSTFTTKGEPPNMQLTPRGKNVKYFGDSGHYTSIRCSNSYFDKFGLLLPAIVQSSPIKVTPGRFIIPIYSGDPEGLWFEMEAKLWDYDSTSDNDTVAEHKFGMRLPPFELNQLRSRLNEDNKVNNYYCSPDGAYDYTDSGNSVISLCVDFYRQDPSSGSAPSPAYASSGPTPTPTGERGPDLTERADLEALSAYVAEDGSIHVRFQNRGVDDLFNHAVTFQVTGTSSQPNLMPAGKIQFNTAVFLPKGGITDQKIIHSPPLDPNKYDYDLTVELGPSQGNLYGAERFHDDDTTNNSTKYTSQVGQLQAVADPLIADLTIAGISIEPHWAASNDVLHVTVKNLGPHSLSNVSVWVECEVDEVVRLGGQHSIWKLQTYPGGVSRVPVNDALVLKLSAGEDPSGKKNTLFDANFFTYWYRASCSLKTDKSFVDPNPKNDFRIEVIQ